MLGLLAGGGPADVAGWVDGWQLEETGGCGRRTLGRSMGGRLADVASGATVTHLRAIQASASGHRWVDDATSTTEGAGGCGWL